MPNALVTGVGRTRGLGAAIARELAAHHWSLALAHHAAYDLEVMHEPSDVDHLAAELSDQARVVVLPSDLADPLQAAALVDRAVAQLGPINALVMSHCHSVDSSIRTTTVEAFDQHYAVNVRASWLLVQAFARHREEAGPGGAVVALTSDHTVDNLPYGATKGALDRLVIAGAHELADLGIRCNVVNPGPVDTGWMDDETRRVLAARTPGGQLGEPASVGRLVRFLVSEEGRWINGQRINSNGGFSPTPV